MTFFAFLPLYPFGRFDEVGPVGLSSPSLSSYRVIIKGQREGKLGWGSPKGDRLNPLASWQFHNSCLTASIPVLLSWRMSGCSNGGHPHVGSDVSSDEQVQGISTTGKVRRAGESVHSLVGRASQIVDHEILEFVQKIEPMLHVFSLWIRGG
ncbi:hypothetical protein cyc_00531 [Cyclospora cayetanensis]|uniref:Uncharacterized protein n=1 Tax=Cyclospora cayetanensis TaxID=88456 RepID=A0A1D3CW09_9EIME|nr:hypothetical protein cyc_00531 [Cyclospora cayetanensis]